MKNYQLSIITVTYNQANLLAKNCQSVLTAYQNSSGLKIEHVIVDGMSTDSTRDTGQKYGSEAPYLVNYIREPDTGIYDAMNKGIKAASGGWLHFLNSDDLLLEGALCEISDQLTDDFDIICFDVYYGDRIWKSEIKNNRFHFPHQGTIINRDFLIDRHGYDTRFKVSADVLFNIKYYKEARTKIINKPIAIMRPGGISSSGSFRAELELALISIYYGNFREKLRYAIKLFRVSFFKTVALIKRK